MLDMDGWRHAAKLGSSNNHIVRDRNQKASVFMGMITADLSLMTCTVQKCIILPFLTKTADQTLWNEKENKCQFKRLLFLLFFIS